MPDFEKQREDITKPLRDRVHLTPDDISDVCRSAARGARAMILATGRREYSMEERDEAVLEELRKIVRKMVERFEAGDDISNIQKGADWGDK